MGLYKQYFRITQYARNQLFGNARGEGTPLQMLISQQGKLSHSKFLRLVSHSSKIN